MENVKNRHDKDETAAVEQPKANHTEKISAQVLAKIGKPPRLHRVEVCKQHNDKYRVNVWEQPEPIISAATLVISFPSCVAMLAVLVFIPATVFRTVRPQRELGKCD